MEWGVGRYEEIAVGLLPAARLVVDLADPQPGEHVVDVGCGTGNASVLAAARTGVRVTGVDPAERLLGVARNASAGLAATFVSGDAARLPVADGAADVVISVFGVVFAPDARAAIAELARIAAPRTRILVTAWLPDGPVFEVVGLLRRATSPPAGRLPFAWHDQASLTSLFAPHGFAVAQHAGELAFTAGSPAAFLDAELGNHPLWVARAATLDREGRLAAFRDDALRILDAANEDPTAFRVTSRYVVATATRE